MRELSKAQTIILLIIFVAIGGLVLYGGNTKDNSSLPEQTGPLNYVFK